jgi:hypothetical protein
VVLPENLAALNRSDEKPYDLLVNGGKVVDPSQNLDDLRDVAFHQSKIAAVERDIPRARARQELDARGRIVTLGLIDLHSHAFPYVGVIGPDPHCVSRGVTREAPAFSPLRMGELEVRGGKAFHSSLSGGPSRHLMSLAWLWIYAALPQTASSPGGTALHLLQMVCAHP